MYELIQVADNTYYIASPVNMGIYVEERNGKKLAWVVDTGIDPRNGKKIAKILKEQEWTLKAVINTHCHVDHIGANAWLQKEFAVPCYADGLDALFIENTILSPMALWGAYPPKVLQTMAYAAQNSKVTDIREADLPQGFEIIPLHGHCLYMFGLRTPDNIVFLADELCNAHIFEKYGIAYNYHVAGYFQSLDEAEKLEAKLFVPSHGDPFTDIKPLVELNRQAVLRTKNLILELCQEPKNFDTLLQGIFNHYGLTLNFAQYALLSSAIRSYLSWLMDEGRLEALAMENMLFWKSKE